MLHVSRKFTAGLLSLAALESFPSLCEAAEQVKVEGETVRSPCESMKGQVAYFARKTCDTFYFPQRYGFAQSGDLELLKAISASCSTYFMSVYLQMNKTCSYREAAKAAEKKWKDDKIKFPGPSNQKANFGTEIGNAKVAIQFLNDWADKLVAAKQMIQTARLRYSYVMRKASVGPLSNQVMSEYLGGGFENRSPAPRLIRAFLLAAVDADAAEKVATETLDVAIANLVGTSESLGLRNQILAIKANNLRSAAKATAAASKESTVAVSEEHFGHTLNNVATDEFKKMFQATLSGIAAEAWLQTAPYKTDAFEAMVKRVAFNPETSGKIAAGLSHEVIHRVAFLGGNAAGLGLDLYFRKDHWAAKDSVFVLLKSYTWGLVSGASFVSGGTATLPLTVTGIGMDTFFTVVEVMAEWRATKNIVERAQKLIEFYEKNPAQWKSSKEFAAAMCTNRVNEVNHQFNSKRAGEFLVFCGAKAAKEQQKYHSPASGSHH